MFESDDSKRSLNPFNPQLGFGFHWIIVFLILFGIGLFEISAYNELLGSENAFASAKPTPTPSSEEVKLRGYVYDRTGTIVRSH